MFNRRFFAKKSILAFLCAIFFPKKLLSANEKPKIVDKPSLLVRFTIEHNGEERSIAINYGSFLNKKGLLERKDFYKAYNFMGGSIFGTLRNMGLAIWTNGDSRQF